MKKYNYIDLTRTIAMFGVVLCHCLLFFSSNPFWFVNADYQSDGAVFLCNILNFTVVQIFVFCSGFLFQASLQSKQTGIPAMILKRAKRILLPFLLYGALWLVPTYTIFDIPTYGRPKGTSLIDGYKSMLLGQFCDVSWFLLMLFWVTLIWIFLRVLLKKKLIFVGAAAAVALYFAAYFLLSEVNFYSISQIDIYIVAFFAGAAFYWISDKINKLPLAAIFAISISGIAACAALSPFASNYPVYCVFAIIMPVFVVILAMGICKLKLQDRVEKSRVYKWLLKHNMDIYLLQAPGMYLSFMWLYPLVGQNSALCVTLCFVLTLAIDFVLVALLTLIRKGLSAILKSVKKGEKA